MWLTRVSEFSEVCLMCFAMTDVLGANENRWFDATKSLPHFQERKASPEKPKVYTNDDLRHSEPKSEAKSSDSKNASSGTTQSSKQKSTSKDSRTSSSALDNYRDLQGHDRSYWQKKIRPLRGKVDSLDLQIQNLQQKQADTNVTTGLRVSGKGHLHSSHRDSPATLAKKMDDLKQKRALVLKSIQEVEEDACKAQAMPEWLR